MSDSRKAAAANAGPFQVLPAEFGRYRVERLLGRGAMGAVYLAYDTQLDRQVALKVARSSSAVSANLLKRMEREAKAAAKVDHPFICKVYDFGEIDGIRFIALQYIEGEDLKSYLKRVGRLRGPAESIRWIVQLASALEAAHEKGVIHRDLKPENVMLNRKGEPVIMDFGLARRATGATDASLTQGAVVGTAAYMSPEQVNGKAEGIDHRSDLYALGVILFEMLTGEWPFTGSPFEIMGQKSVQDPPSPLSLNPSVPHSLAEVCRKMLAKKKEDRYFSCRDVVHSLESICQGSADVPSIIQDPAMLEFLNGLATGENERRSAANHRDASAETATALAAVTSVATPIPHDPLNFEANREVTVTGTVAALPKKKLLANPRIWIGAAIAIAAIVTVGLVFLRKPVSNLTIVINDSLLSVRIGEYSVTAENSGRPITLDPDLKHMLSLRYRDEKLPADFQVTMNSGESRKMELTVKNGMILMNGKPLRGARIEATPEAVADSEPANDDSMKIAGSPIAEQSPPQRSESVNLPTVTKTPIVVPPASRPQPSINTPAEAPAVVASVTPSRPSVVVIPDEFQRYFERSDEAFISQTAKLEQTLVQLQKDIDDVETLPVDKTRYQKERLALRGRLKNLKPSFVFGLRPVAGELGVLSGAKVVAKQDKTSVIAKDAEGHGFLLIELNPKLSMNPGRAIEDADVWQVVRVDTPDRDQSDHLKIDRLVVLRSIDKTELESHRATYDERRKAAAKKEAGKE